MTEQGDGFRRKYIKTIKSRTLSLPTIPLKKVTTSIKHTLYLLLCKISLLLALQSCNQGGGILFTENNVTFEVRDSNLVSLALSDSSSQREILIDARRVKETLKVHHLRQGHRKQNRFTFYPGGELQFIESFDSGVQTGLWYSYYPNGTLNTVIRTDRGVRIGNAMFYDSLGRMVQHNFYDAYGDLFYEKKLNEKGEIVKEFGQNGIGFFCESKELKAGEVFSGDVCVVLPRFISYTAYYAVLSESNDTLLKRSVTDEILGFNITMKDKGIYRFILKGKATGIGSWSEDYSKEVEVIVN
jgi:hypothetical protein